MPTDPFRAIAAMARAEAARTTTPVTPEPRRSTESTEPEPETSERRRTFWREIARRIRHPRSG
ncbi:hypothetical protein ITI46_21390 [Streptomyces oryzae]|uniref:Uncharacterized protein n=1 Tax=Streptomyces oryzae TaxID=1434886 RepID=A0ABS3XFP2_9ACTN|nr:hypothetical protein [Streptomyces oryzae]MBO8194194.1 hypothetical protein [Streptomyces oryzae]